MRRVLLLSCVLLVAAADEGKMKAGVFDPPRQAPELSLTGSDGSELTLARYRGKVVLLGFGFTSCPDVCPITLATLAKARKQLGPQADELQVVYITVDPERDDAARMKKYLDAFDPAFVGGTGPAERLAALRKEYGILTDRKAVGTGYVISHSSYTYLIDRKGRIRGLMPYGRAAEDYVHDIRILLRK